MRKLTIEEIEKFSSWKDIRKIAVENFLMSMGKNYVIAMANLELDTHLYKWNKETVKAIMAGIILANKKGDK